MAFGFSALARWMASMIAWNSMMQIEIQFLFNTLSDWNLLVKSYHQPESLAISVKECWILPAIRLTCWLEKGGRGYKWRWWLGFQNTMWLYVALKMCPQVKQILNQLLNNFQKFPLMGLFKDSLCPENQQASSLLVQNVTLENTVTYRISIRVSSFDNVAIIVHNPHGLCNCFGLFYLLYFGSVCLKRSQRKKSVFKSESDINTMTKTMVEAPTYVAHWCNLLILMDQRNA